MSAPSHGARAPLIEATGKRGGIAGLWQPGQVLMSH